MAPIPRGSGPVQEFRWCPEPLAEVCFRNGQGVDTSVAAWLATSETDGYLLLRNDGIVLEYHANGFGAADRHALMSISKSVCGALAGWLIRQGAVEPQRAVTDYLPELRDTAYRDVSVVQLWHMRSGVAFDADTTKPHSDVIRLGAAIGWRAPATPDAPRSLLAFLRGLRRRAAPPGSRFAYSDADTEVLARVLERAGGETLPALLAREIWQAIGAEDDAGIAVDAEGTAVASAGLCMGLRDLGRFARWWLQQQEDNDALPAAVEPGFPPAGSAIRGYRQQMWLLEQGQAMLGNNGQSVVILPDAGLIAVKLASLPDDRPGVIAREHAEAWRAARRIAERWQLEPPGITRNVDS